MKESVASALASVEKYCKQVNLDAEHAKRILGILESELHHRRDLNTIYIHPSPDDSKMFFGEHFSLSPKKLSDLVRSGFRAGIETLSIERPGLPDAFIAIAGEAAAREMGHGPRAEAAA